MVAEWSKTLISQFQVENTVAKVPVNTESVYDAITRSVHNKFNCITVFFDRTQHGIKTFKSTKIPFVNCLQLIHLGNLPEINAGTTPESFIIEN